MLHLTDTSWPELLARTCRHRLITPAFQPIIDLARGTVAGYEGLARFDEAGSLDCSESMPPEQWFTAAALHGYSAELEAAAIIAILSQRSALPPNTFLSVNVSPEALQSVEIGMALSGFDDLSGVVIELTEQTPVSDYPAFLGALDALRQRGALVAIDDTGAGYSGLTHLLAVRPQFVKLDRGLVAGLDRDPSRAAAVAAIGAFADEMDAWIIAEGVEFPAELQRLIDLRVPLVQGFLLGRPGPRMQDLPTAIGAELRHRHAIRRNGQLHGLMQPVPVLRVPPTRLVETSILLDEQGRPLEVLTPVGDGGWRASPAMCVLAHERLADISLRAAARDSAERFCPLCLVDDQHHLIGIIPVESLLQALARTQL